MCMKVQKVLSSTTNPNVGEAIPVPAQACLYIYVFMQNAEPFYIGAPASRTRVGILYCFKSV